MNNTSESLIHENRVMAGDVPRDGGHDGDIMGGQPTRPFISFLKSRYLGLVGMWGHP